MVMRHKSPSFFFRYQALISPPGPPPTISRTSIDSCYLPVTFPPAYGDPPTRNLPSPPYRVPDGARSGKAKIPPRSRDSERQFDVFGRQRANSVSGDSHLPFSRSAFVPERKMNNRRRSEIEAKRPAGARKRRQSDILQRKTFGGREDEGKNEK